MSADPQSYQRATLATAIGLVIHLVGVVALFLIGIWLRRYGMLGDGVFIAFLAGVPVLFIWALLLVYFIQSRLAAMESRDIDNVNNSASEDQSIFDLGDDVLRLHEKRLGLMTRFGLPVMSIFVGVTFLAMGILFMIYTAVPGLTLTPVEEMQVRELYQIHGLAPQVIGLISIIMVILMVLAGRYMAVMSKRDDWKLLRSGAGYLMSIAVIFAALALAMAGAWAENFLWLRWFTVLVSGIMILLGAEILLIFMLEIYRPRQAGEFARPAFDSRLLSLLATPEGIAKTINEFINYQFGFEITSNWFWQLLSRAFLPLVGFGALSMIAMSSIFTVQPGHQAAVHSLGQLSVVRESGIHFKLPWPLAQVEKIEVDQLKQITIGRHGSQHMIWAQRRVNRNKTISDMQRFWDSAVIEDTEFSLVRRDMNDQDAAGISNLALIAIELDIQYRVKNLDDYLAAQTDPDNYFRVLAEEVMTAQLLSRDFDQMLGNEHVGFTKAVKKDLQMKSDLSSLGLEVVTVSVISSQPNPDLAPAVRERVSSQAAMRTAIEGARTQAIQRLSESVGGVDMALDLSKRIVGLNETNQKEQALRAEGKTTEADALLKKMIEERQAIREELSGQSSGKVARMIAEAKSYRQRAETRERVRLETFRALKEAYEVSPQLFEERRRLEVISQGLARLNKYILLGEWAKLNLRYRFDESGAGALNAQTLLGGNLEEEKINY